MRRPDMTLHQLSGTEFGTLAPNAVLVAVDLSRAAPCPVIIVP